MVPAAVLQSFLSARRPAARVGPARQITPSLARAGLGHTAPNRRKEIRKSVYMGCRVSRMSNQRLLGDRMLDLSPQGMFLLSDDFVEPGSEVFVSFQATDLPIWFDTRATVARIVAGRRLGDDGAGIGLRFRSLSAVSRVILRGHLDRAPRRAPQRPWARGAASAAEAAEVDYARIVKDIIEGRI